MASAAGGAGGDPLAVSCPSLVTVLQYPFLASSIRILCEQDGRQQVKQASLSATITALWHAHRAEGLAGLYRGAPLYALHQAARDVLRLLAGRGLNRLRVGGSSGGEGNGGEGNGDGDGGGVKEAPVSGPPPRGVYCLRLAAKYLIDAACYPLLLASTRAVLLRDDAGSPWQRLRAWREAEGLRSLFGGLAASLACTALEEAADALLERCIERCCEGAGDEVGSVERLSLKVLGTQVASVLTAPLSCVGVVQRCQSALVPGLPAPRPLWSTVRSLPWLSSLWQLLGLGGVFALQLKMIGMKLEFEAYQEELGRQEGGEGEE